MQFTEYGKAHPRTVMLLHGGGLSWWNYRAAAELLQTDCHVILPVLDGHAGSDRPFTTIEHNAAEIIEWIDANLGGRVSAAGGLSLGGQILLEMLSQRKDLCRAALIESAMVIPSALTHALIAPAFGCSYGLIRSERFARMQFRALHIDPALFADYYRDTCAVRKADLIAFMKANTAYALKDTLAECTASLRIFAGGKETRGILRSAEKIRQTVPDSTLTVLPGLTHGAFSMNHAAEYAETVRQMLAEQHEVPGQPSG